MSKRFKSGRLNTGEEINPLDGMINLADIMLVLACGLMLALIIAWNIDIGGTGGEAVQVNQGQEVSGMQGLNNNDENSDESMDLAKYKKMGVVYKDPSTGKLYMVASDE